jgi:hypothetical protein
MDTNTTGVIPAVSTLTRANLSLAYRYGKLGLIIILVFVIIVGNAITIAAVVCTNKLRRAPTNTFVVNLAMADEMVGWLLGVAMVLPFVLDTEQALRTSVCLIRAPYYSTLAVSTYTLLAIAVDRFLAVVHPLSYKRRMTITRARVISGMIWICQLIIIGGTTCYYGITVTPTARVATGAIKDLIPKNAFIWAVLPQIYIPLAGNIILYGCIFVSIRKRQKMSNTVTPGVSTGSRASEHDKMVTAVTKMMCMVLGYLIVAWLPYFSLTNIYSQGDAMPFWFVYTIDAASMLIYSNSAINPFIYSWHHKDFRQAYTRLLRCQKTSPASTSNTTTV